MYKNFRVLGTICARGGSKGIKNKNIRQLGGKPMICYSLDLVRESQLVDDYVVSTDSEAIMDVVRTYGFEIHFKRPVELAGDEIPRIDAIRHATKWAEEHFKKKYDIVVDLGVATPLKNVEDLNGCIGRLVDENASNVISVTPASRNPYFNMVEEYEGKIGIVKKGGKVIAARQKAPKVYAMNDAFNVFWHDTLFSKNPQLNDKTAIYVMPRDRSVDIDDEFDLKFAEYVISHEHK